MSGDTCANCAPIEAHDKSCLPSRNFVKTFSSEDLQRCSDLFGRFCDIHGMLQEKIEGFICARVPDVAIMQWHLCVG
ncbi:MAG: hypothetical protein CL912_25545 [Deltaproteobacteria bacterium]|nr:hypothetical protein [Deltaproteobacteria bacterium]